jgi:D-alanine-D-alanine ligase
MINLFVACAIDKDVAAEVLSNNPRSTRGKYDISVVQSLRRLYRKVEVVSVSDGNAQVVDSLMRLRPDVVFNLALSIHNLEASFAGMLDMMRLKYTGSSPRGIILGNDKATSRLLLADAKIPVPAFVRLVQGVDAGINIPPPLIVKPESEASSAGIYDDSVVMNALDAKTRAARIWKRFETPALCEEFVVGREFRISLVEVRGILKVGGIIEWHFGVAKPGWGFRTHAMRINSRIQAARKMTRSQAVLPLRKVGELADIAKKAMAALDIRGYTTLDVRMNNEGQFKVLEANANPGLWSESRLWNNPSFDLTIKRIVQAALHRG